jgi:signal transduction histidine kinase
VPLSVRQTIDLRSVVIWLANVRLHALVIGALALAVLVFGWGLDVTIARQQFLDFPAMTPFTAGEFVLLSCSILCTLLDNRLGDLAAGVLASSALFLALGTFILTFVDQSFEHLLIPSRGVIVCVAASAVATAALALRLRRPVLIAFIALGGLAPCLFRIFEMVFLFAGPLPKRTPLETMAISTAILQVWFLISCVLLHPSLHFRRVISETGLRGSVLRQALPAALLVPTIAGALGLALSVIGGWNHESFYAATATLTVLAGVQFIWTASNAIGRWQEASNGYASRLARANEALEQYASSAAHDLRAPARHIHSFSQLFQEAMKQDDRTSALRYAQIIQQSASELPILIEKLLDYARSGHTQIVIDKYALRQLVEAAIGVQANNIAAAGAKVEIVSDAVMQCDATLMTVVFQNIIANSLKNRHPERPLRIAISALREDDQWRLEVQDNGQGFEPGFAAVAFSPLAQGTSAAGRGVGLGLSICRTIVRSHGGQIRADPTVENGALIVINMPDDVAAAASD